MRYRKVVSTTLWGTPFAALGLMLAWVTSGSLGGGRIELTGRQVLEIHEGKFTRHYRICVDPDKSTAPLEVTDDGRAIVLAAGECRRIVGKRIEASPARPLSEGGRIVADYTALKS